MARASDDHRFVRDHWMKLDVGGYVHERPNREIYKPSAKPLQTFQAGDVVEPQLDLWMGASKEFHVFRQYVENRGPAGSDLDAAFINFAAALFELFIQVLQLIDER